MSFNIDDFEKVEQPQPEPEYEVTFNTDGKITFNPDLSKKFRNSKGQLLPQISSASIFTKSVSNEKNKQVTKEIFIQLNEVNEEQGCCTVLLTQGANPKVRINTKGCINQIGGVKVKGKKWGSNAVSMIGCIGTGNITGVLVDVSKRAKPNKKKRSRTIVHKTEPSAPAGEQATPQSQKTAGLTTNEFGAVQLK